MDDKSKYLRRLIVRQLVSQGRGHVGSAMSLVEILRVLYDDILKFNAKNPDWKGRDRLILSKGHGCLALYAILADKGFFPLKTLDTFCSQESILGGHPEPHIPGVEWSTGSLGHGMAVGTGIAISIINKKFTGPAVRQPQSVLDSKYSLRRGWGPRLTSPVLKSKGKSPQVYVILGDGECDEGSVWEAALIAGKHKLSNLTVIVDYNKIQSYGKIPEVQPLEPIADKWRAFGFEVREADGHNADELRKTFSGLPLSEEKPSCIIAHTVKGKGISFIENRPEWHHKRGLGEREIRELYEGIDNYVD